MYPDHTASSNPVYAIFYCTFSINLAISDMVSQYLALIALLWRVDHSKGKNYHFMTNTDLYFASYVRTTITVR